VTIAGASGCAVQMYDGVLRPRNEVAIIDVEGMRVRKIDGRYAEDGTTYIVLPGMQAVSVYLRDDPAPGTSGARYSDDTLAICVDAQAGRQYRLSPVYARDEWWPQVVDATTSQRLQATVQKTDRPYCYQPVPIRRPPSPAPAVAATTVAATGAVAVQNGQGAGDDDDDDDDDDDRGTPAVVAVRQPRGHVLIGGGGSGRAAPAEHSIGSLRFETGIAFGGALLASGTYASGGTEELHAGDGASLSFGASWTPLWAYDAIGFGVDFDMGIKYASIEASNGGIQFLRAPLLLSGHALFAVAPHWSILLRAGAEKDVGPQLSSSGSLNLGTATLDSQWGEMIEIGPYYTGTRVGLSLPVRATVMNYRYGGATIAANSIGAGLSLHYDFLEHR
jgi:hypothetical protein